MPSSPTNSTSRCARRCWSITPSQFRWRCCGRAPQTGRCKIVPIEINTVQHPLPSPARCFKLGRSIGRAIETYERDLRVLVVGTGGLSHQLDGTRAGFINKPFDWLCLDKIVGEPEALTRYSIHEWVKQAGIAGCRIAQLDRDARRADGTREQASRQLSHPDFKYRGGDGCLRQSKAGRAQGRVRNTGHHRFRINSGSRPTRSGVVLSTPDDRSATARHRHAL